jgi:hypothetical protein
MSDGEVAFAKAGRPPRPLNVMVRGDEVIIYLPDGATLTMSALEAELSAKRLLDAAEVAHCRVPTAGP